MMSPMTTNDLPVRGSFLGSGPSHAVAIRVQSGHDEYRWDGRLFDRY